MMKAGPENTAAPAEWTEKYRPSSVDDIIGNGKAVGEFTAWAKSWNSGMPESAAVILHGPAGVGKTSAAHAVANDMGWEVIELNASDQRTAAIIQRVVGSASRTVGLSGSEHRMIILDEADNIHGNYDRGGVQAIIGIIKTALQPMVLIANEYYDMSKTLRGVCTEIKFNKIQSRSIMPALRSICDAEGIHAEGLALDTIAEGANGDLRSAINDLQAVAMGRSHITPDDVIISGRDRRESIFDVLAHLFRRSGLNDAMHRIYDLDERPDELINWIVENLPESYDNEDSAHGFNYLSRADVFLGRVRRRQSYSLWRYASSVMVGGTMVSRSHKYKGFVRYRRPSFFMRLGRTRSVRGIRDSLTARIGDCFHVSRRYARSDLMYILRMICSDASVAVYVVARMGLGLDETAMLLDMKKTSKKVKTVFADASELAERIGPVVSPDFLYDFNGSVTDGGGDEISGRTPDVLDGGGNGNGADDPGPDRSQQTLFDF